MLDKTKIGANIASLANHPFWDSIDQLLQLGFHSVELLGMAGSRHSLGLLPGAWLDDLSAEEFERLRRALANFAHTSIHAPFVDAPLFTYNRRIAQEAFRQVKVCIEGAGHLEMRAVAVHANARRFIEPRDYWDDMVHVFRQLGEAAKEANVVVGVETGYPTRYDLFLQLIRDIDHPAVGATVDIGHVAYLEESEPRSTNEGIRNYNRNLVSLCEELGDRVVHMHMHDVRKVDWRDHRTVGTGVIDMRALFEVLKKIGYDGLMQLELEEPEQEDALLQSKRRLEALADTVNAGSNVRA